MREREEHCLSPGERKGFFVGILFCAHQTFKKKKVSPSFLLVTDPGRWQVSLAASSPGPRVAIYHRCILKQSKIPLIYSFKHRHYNFKFLRYFKHVDKKHFARVRVEWSKVTHQPVR